MTELKPCPFCGGSNVSITYRSYDNKFCVYHDSDDCALNEPILIDGEVVHSLKEAYEFWNRRNEQ